MPSLVGSEMCIRDRLKTYASESKNLGIDEVVKEMNATN